MSELNYQLLTVTKFILFFLSVSLLSWAVYPPWREFAAGLMLGFIAAGINFGLLHRRVSKITTHAAEHGNKRQRLGFLTRVAIVLLFVLLAMRIPGVDVYSVIIGYLLIHLAILCLHIIDTLRRKG
jgi:ATP synthase protein I